MQIAFFTFHMFAFEHLTLHNCIIHHPSAFEGFDRLITLELCEVTISSELLKSLIAHCPLLTRLVLEISELLDIIEINAPMPRSFDFKGYISSLCLKNFPLLAKLTLIGKDSHDADYFYFAKLFESCPALEHILLDFWYAECQTFLPATYYANGFIWALMCSLLDKKLPIFRISRNSGLQ